jgi:hypothetical protein
VSASKRPLSVTVLACLYIVVGAAAFAQHLYPVIVHRALHSDDLLAAISATVAVGSGAFMLRGDSWARWLAVGWMALHVVVSSDSLQKVTVHGLLLVVIVCCLFHREANGYFRCRASARAQATPETRRSL